VTGFMKIEPKPSDREVLAGLVERVTFHNEENGIRKKAHRRPDEKVQSSQANSGCMLSGARRVIQ
jgi:hypothetical protein